MRILTQVDAQLKVQILLAPTLSTILIFRLVLPGSEAFGVAAKVREGASTRGQSSSGKLGRGGNDDYGHDGEQCRGFNERKP